MAILLFTRPPALAPASFVFQDFVNLTGQDSMPYAFLVGLLFPAWTFLGYDASAHISEETIDSHIHAARGITMAVVTSAIVGFFLLLATLFAIQDFNAVLGSTFPAPVTQIYMDSVGREWSTVIMVIVFTCGLTNVVGSVIANSRVTYTWARDGGFGVRLSKFLYWGHPTTKLPLRGVWLMCIIGMLLSIIGFGSAAALPAFSSLGVIGLMVSYALPISGKLLITGDSFKPGVYNNGRYSKILNVISVAWVAFLTVLFSLPSTFPVTAQNLNYAPILLVVWSGMVTTAWFLSAKKWFKGPVVHVTEEEIDTMESKANEEKMQLGATTQV
ncbi:hypothetical protein HDU93_009159 [Gonapodya sp. JEL0774]|nr:hypothetical protein HDU93_009159 [Gonapodya sp. JEL0774]